MKKNICLILSFMFIILCFAGCDKPVTEVTDENVKELFTPSLKAAMYEYGSYFYELEKDETGKPVEYPSNNDIFIGYFKAETKISQAELVEKIAKYVKDRYRYGYSSTGLITSTTYEENGDLYIPYPNFNEVFFDINSITLEDTVEDGYYISVDSYGGGDAEFDIYGGTYTFFVKTVDGILQIQELIEVVRTEPINNSDNLDLIGTLDKFLGPVQERIS